MEGDALFMQSLSQHTLEDKFEVSCGLVTIRGGVRKPQFLCKNFAWLPWDSSKWVRMPSFSPLFKLQPFPQNSTVVPAGAGEVGESSSTSTTITCSTRGLVHAASVPPEDNSDQTKNEVRETQVAKGKESSIQEQVLC